MFTSLLIHPVLKCLSHSLYPGADNFDCVDYLHQHHRWIHRLELDDFTGQSAGATTQRVRIGSIRPALLRDTY